MNGAFQCATSGSMKEQKQKQISSDSVNDKELAIEATLFLIPMVIGFESKQKEQNDSLSIIKLGEIRKLMVKHGLISNTEENVSLLTEFFTFDEIACFNETKKSNVIQFFLTQDKKYAISRNDRIPTGNIQGGILDLRLKFLVGCAQLKSDASSLLSRLLTPVEDDLNDQEIGRAVQFLNELTGILPWIVNQREGVKVKFCSVFSMVEVSRIGMRSAIGEYDQFKWNMLLKQTENMNSPRILINQSSPDFLDISLLEGGDIVNPIRIYALHETQQDMLEFLNQFFNDLESRGFSLESDVRDILTFSKRIRRDRGQRISPTLRVLH